VNFNDLLANEDLAWIDDDGLLNVDLLVLAVKSKAPLNSETLGNFAQKIIEAIRQKYIKGDTQLMPCPTRYKDNVLTFLPEPHIKPPLHLLPAPSTAVHNARKRRPPTA